MKTIEEKVYQKDTQLIEKNSMSMNLYMIDMTPFTQAAKGLILGKNLVVKSVGFKILYRKLFFVMKTFMKVGHSHRRTHQKALCKDSQKSKVTIIV